MVMPPRYPANQPIVDTKLTLFRRLSAICFLIFFGTITFGLYAFLSPDEFPIFKEVTHRLALSAVGGLAGILSLNFQICRFQREKQLGIKNADDLAPPSTFIH